MLEYLMVAIDKLGGSITITQTDLDRVVNGENEVSFKLDESNPSDAITIELRYAK